MSEAASRETQRSHVVLSSIQGEVSVRRTSECIICPQNIAAFHQAAPEPPEACSRRPRTDISIQTCALFNDLCRMFEDEDVIDHFFLFRLRSGHPLAFKRLNGLFCV